MKSNGLITAYYFILFTILYFFTLNFNYVEGDDALTVLYHLCGRDSAIQKPYAGYNSGLDFVIQLSGAKTEESIRTFAVFISFIGGLFLLIGCKSFLETFFKENDKVNQKTRTLFYLLLPFLIPDILFHSLIVNSTNISFALILYSMACFINFLKSRKNYWLVVSLLLFAIAIPFRWTMLVSIPVYLGLMIYFIPLKLTREILQLYFKVSLAGMLGLVLTVYFIYLTGYNLQGIVDTITSTTNYLSKADFSVLSLLASGSAFITPPLLLLVLFSFFKLRIVYNQQRKSIYSLLGFVILSVSPFFLFGFFPSFKFLLTALPALLVLMMFGLDYLRKKKALMTVFGLSLVSIWFVGLQIDATGTLCGPGFELGITKIVSQKRQNGDFENIDERVKIKKVFLTFDSGFYMPMAEGPRPIYGYFHVLFNNGWYDQIQIFTNDRKELVKLLRNDPNIIYVQDRRAPYVSCDLYQNGYITKTDFIDKKSYLYRDFVKGSDTIQLKIIPDNCSKPDWICSLRIPKDKKVIYRSSYSSEILHLYNCRKNQITILDPFTAILK